MPRILKNPDGTVNLDAVKKETQHLQGKYAQNAANFERNTKAEVEAAQHADGANHHQQQQHDKKAGDVAEPKAAESSD